MIEYFSGETLRWSFGFDNPNEAAVIFACLLPLCWWAWAASWEIKAQWQRCIAATVSALAFLAAGSCLILTFSRGGLVAAAVALGYVWVRQFGNAEGRHRRGMQGKWFFGLSMILILALAGVSVWQGLANRSVTALGGDASVSNRWDLWKAGLQMAYENPPGTGFGKSGWEFMQWYQPVERTESYRTMVNSYLTFLVERGWGLFALSLFGFFGLWFISASVGDACEVSTALRASLVAFGVAGIFSTTMENGVLWILPGGASVLLAIFVSRDFAGKAFGWPLLRAGGTTMLLLLVLWATGAALSRRDILSREFTRGAVGAVSLREEGSRETIDLYSDENVLGDRWGKLVRTLVLEADVRVRMGGVNLAGKPGRTVVAGREIERCGEKPEKGWLLIAPAIPQGNSGGLPAALNDRPIMLFLSEIDEDGRANWWNERASSMTAGDIQVHTLSGVGTQVDWAWDQIIEAVGQQL